MNHLAHRLAALAAACLLAFAAVPAAAQSVEERVDMLLGDAYADYDMLQLDAAQDKLFDALDLIEANDVRTPGAAGVYIMIGVVTAAIEGDSWSAFDWFVEGAFVDPMVEIHPYYATPSLQEVLADAKLEAAAMAPQWQEPEPEPYVPPTPPTPPTPPVVTPPTPPVVTPPTPPVASGPALMHTPVSEAAGGRPLTLSARVAIGAPITRVTVNYRPFGERNFYAAELNPTGDGTTWAGDVPGSALRGVISLDYFVLATDASGNTVATSGNAAAPHTVFVVGGGDGPDRSRNRGNNRSRSSGEGEIFHLTLGAGTGIGLATAEPNVYAEDVELNPGLAPTPLHLAAELGFAPGRRSLHIVPFLRLQMVFLDSGTELEPLAGLKIRYFFKDGGPFRVYGQGGAGYGYVSHLVLLEQIEAGTYDTTNEGPIHVGGGIGFNYMFSDNVGIQLDTYLMAMFTEFSLQLDATAGLYIAF